MKRARSRMAAAEMVAKAERKKRVRIMVILLASLAV